MCQIAHYTTQGPLVQELWFVMYILQKLIKWIVDWNWEFLKRYIQTDVVNSETLKDVSVMIIAPVCVFCCALIPAHLKPHPLLSASVPCTLMKMCWHVSLRQTHRFPIWHLCLSVSQQSLLPVSSNTSNYTTCHLVYVESFFYLSLPVQVTWFQPRLYKGTNIRNSQKMCVWIQVCHLAFVLLQNDIKNQTVQALFHSGNDNIPKIYWTFCNSWCSFILHCMSSFLFF